MYSYFCLSTVKYYTTQRDSLDGRFQLRKALLGSDEWNRPVYFPRLSPRSGPKGGASNDFPIEKGCGKERSGPAATSSVARRRRGADTSNLLRLRCRNISACLSSAWQHPHATCCNPRTYDYKIFAPTTDRTRATRSKELPRHSRRARRWTIYRRGKRELCACANRECGEN